MHRLQFNHQSNVLKQWDGRATWYGDLQISCLMHKVTVFVLISNINAHEFNNIVHGYQDDTKQIYTITTLIIWLPDTKASVMFSPPYTIQELERKEEWEKQISCQMYERGRYDKFQCPVTHVCITHIVTDQNSRHCNYGGLW